jgi:hypothetical protein
VRDATLRLCATDRRFDLYNGKEMEGHKASLRSNFGTYKSLSLR